MRLAFALFLKITLFVVLLSLYIHGWKIYMLSTALASYPSRISSFAKRTHTSMYAFYPSSLSLFSPLFLSLFPSLSLSHSLFFLFLSFSASPPRVRYPAMPPAVHASPGMRESTSGLPSLWFREIYSRTVHSPGCSRWYLVTPIPDDVAAPRRACLDKDTLIAT